MARVRLTDVAEAADVHVSTASRALDPQRANLVNAETRDRVLAAAGRLGYEPPPVGRGPARRASQTIGVIVPDISNPVFASVIRGIENTLEGRQMMALVAETQGRTDRLQRVLEHLRRRRVDAIIIAAAPTGQADTLRALAQRIPIVLAAGSIPGAGLPCVTYDDERGGSLVAEHLLELGHQHVAMVRGPQDVTTFAARATGFLRRLEGSGVRVTDPGEEANQPTLPEGFRLTTQLLQRASPPLTAIFAHNDELATGALQALRTHHLRCPEDVALVGYNDVPVARLLTPALTTIRLPSYELGQVSADIAVGVLSGEVVGSSELAMPLSLQARASTLGDQWDESPNEPGSGLLASSPGT